jgi:heat shock protein HslJ
VQFSTGAAVLESDGGSAAMNQERTADGFLYVGGGQSLRGRGHEATWTEHGKARACHDATGDPANVKSALDGTAWQLIRFQNASGDDVVPPNLDRYTLRFLADGALALQLDCNRASGRWQDAPSDANSGSLTLSGGAMTRAMCGPGAIDTQLARDLAKIHHYDVRKGRLSLRLQDGSRYEWSPLTGGG